MLCKNSKGIRLSHLPIFIGIAGMVLLCPIVGISPFEDHLKVSAQEQDRVVHIEIGASIPSFQKSLKKPSYDPENIPKTRDLPGIPIDSTITWINDDESFHTVTSGNVSNGPDGKFDSGIISPQGSWNFTFNAAGNFDYFCTVHPFMKGSVRVASNQTG